MGMQNSTRFLPPLDLLRGFESAARHLSFTKAAAELFLTQSAVSRQIQSLEDFLGAPLFERRHKALALTDAGITYYRTVAAVLGELREATQRLRERAHRHVLTVTSTVSFASMWLVPRLARFQKEHPEIDVRVSATPLVVDMEREGIDLAIRDCPDGTAPAGAVRLMGEQICAVCSPAYLSGAGGALAEPSQLRHHVLLALHDPAGRWPWLQWTSWLEAAGLEDLQPAGRLSYDQYDQVIQAALHGQGVALGRMTLVNRMIRGGQLIALFGSRRQLTRAFHAVFSRGASARPEVRRFVEWMQREIDREARETGPTAGKTRRAGGG